MVVRIASYTRAVKSARVCVCLCVCVCMGACVRACVRVSACYLYNNRCSLSCEFTAYIISFICKKCLANSMIVTPRLGVNIGHEDCGLIANELLSASEHGCAIKVITTMAHYFLGDLTTFHIQRM